METGDALRKVGITVAWLGIAIYVSSLLQWFLLVVLAIRFPSAGQWAEFLDVLPCIILLKIFVAAVLQRMKPKRHWSLLALALAIMVMWSSYDYAHENYQIGEHSAHQGWDQYHVPGMGATHHYINWPWLTFFN